MIRLKRWKFLENMDYIENIPVFDIYRATAIRLTVKKRSSKDGEQNQRDSQRKRVEHG